MAKFLYDIVACEGMLPEVGLLFSALEDSTREWREELGDVSTEALIWQPFPGGHSIGAVLLHIAEVEDFWFNHVCLGEETPEELSRELLSAEIDQYASNWPTPPAEPFEWYLEKLVRVRARTRAACQRFADLHEPLGLEEWPFQVTRPWAMSHVVQHDSYHGGQAVFLKLLWERTR